MAQKSELIKLAHIVTVPLSLHFVAGGRVGYLKARGIEFHALTSPGEELGIFGEREGVPVHAVKMSRRITPLPDAVAIVNLWRRLRRIRPQVVQAGTPKGGLLGMISSWLARVPVRIYHVYGLPFATAPGFKRDLLRWSEKVSCLLAHQVLFMSQSNQELAVAEGLCPPSKTRILGRGSLNGVDTSRVFNPDSVGGDARQQVRARYSIPSDSLVLTFVGRIVRDKGLVELMSAWRVLEKEFPTLHLMVVGAREPQDPVPPDVRRIMDSHPRIHVTGPIQDMAPIYAATDLFTLPTYREGFPVTPLEAAAMALPVVATRVPGCVDAIQNGVTGTLVPARDAEALLDAIRMYLKDPILRRRHGLAGRERVLRDFQPEAIWAAQYDEYLRLLEEKGLPLPELAPGAVHAALTS
jgi:glycosyltransferase involved in cell wall biosynthesis